MNRLYALSYQDPRRPVYVEDAGHLFSLKGLVMGGMGSTFVLFFPDEVSDDDEWLNVQTETPDLETWSELLRASDSPMFYGRNKPWFRKIQRVISGKVQQRIWWRDMCTCMYCGRDMGEVQLTVDHFVPIEMGGADEDTNYLTACRRCNKDKGCMPPDEWCEVMGYDYKGLGRYLKITDDEVARSEVMTEIRHLAHIFDEDSQLF